MQSEHVIKHYNSPDSLEYWIVKGKFHREDGPAYIKYDKGLAYDIRWYINGNYHRENGPAKVLYDPDTELLITEEWYKNGLLHRYDGPALIYYKNGEKALIRWYINDIELRKTDFTSLETIDRMRAYSLFSPVEIARMRKYAT